MAFRYPPSANTPAKRMGFVQRCYARLHLIHNLMGKWAATGLTQDEYDNGVPSEDLNSPVTGVTVVLPAGMKANWSYQPQIDMAAFRAWSRGPYMERWRLVDGAAKAIYQYYKDRNDWDNDFDFDDMGSF